MQEDYTPLQYIMFFSIILAMFIGFGIYVYKNKDRPKLETREMSQSEETLNNIILLNRLGLFNPTQPTMNLIK